MPLANTPPAFALWYYISSQLKANPPQQVKDKEMDLYNMHYDISQPVDTVFNAIEDLAELAERTVSPMSAQQMIDLAYVIFAKQPILQHDLHLWNCCPPRN